MKGIRALGGLVLQLLAGVVALVSFPLRIEGKIVAALDSWTMKQWAETAVVLEQGGVRSPEERKAAAELRAIVIERHGLNRPKVASLVRPATVEEAKALS